MPDTLTQQGYSRSFSDKWTYQGYQRIIRGLSGLLSGLSGLSLGLLGLLGLLDLFGTAGDHRHSFRLELASE